MVLLVADKKLDKKLKIDVLRYTGYENINKAIGHLDGGDAFLFYLPEGERCQTSLLSLLYRTTQPSRL